MDRRNFIAGCLGLPLLAQAGEAQAQAGLTKMTFPFAAGAGGDTLCRLIAQEMAPALQRTRSSSECGPLPHSSKRLGRRTIPTGSRAT